MKFPDQTVFFSKISELCAIARGGNGSLFRIDFRRTSLAGTALSAAAVTCALAVSAMILRNDLIEASAARQAVMRQAYEDGVSERRAQADQIASLQMSDVYGEESIAGRLPERPGLSSQHPEHLLSEIAGATAEDIAADPAAETEFQASLPVAEDPAVAMANASPFSFWSVSDAVKHDSSSKDRKDRVFVAIDPSLRGIEHVQLARIATLAQDAARTADAIAQALEDANLKIDAGYGKQDVGGPFIAAGRTMMFDAGVKELDEALKHLEAMKSTARKYPIANPVPGRGLSSRFGVRKDPMNGMPAMHAGLDFRAPTGTPALATASGVVIRAGWSGGYGRMVEIRHTNGFTTRYGHLSKIRVKAGQKISTGQIIGDVGSTGRSTGPHLHYEIRRNGSVVNPVGFLKAGRKVEKFL